MGRGGPFSRKGAPSPQFFTEHAPLPAKPENARRYVVPYLAGTDAPEAVLEKGVRLAPRVGVLDEQAAFVQHFKHGADDLVTDALIQGKKGQGGNDTVHLPISGETVRKPAGVRLKNRQVAKGSAPTGAHHDRGTAPPQPDAGGAMPASSNCRVTVPVPAPSSTTSPSPLRGAKAAMLRARHTARAYHANTPR